MDPTGTERPTPAGTLAQLDDATARMLDTVAGLTDEQARAPSALPGWTRGHVLSHLARNADGLGRLITWAETGVVTPMYASAGSRAADIEAGAGRPADELLADVRASAAQFRERAAAMPEGAGDVEVAMLSGAEAYGWEIPLLRVREVLVHTVDLDLALGVSDWPEPFCTWTLDHVAPGVQSRGESPVGRLRAPDGAEWTLGTAEVDLTGPVQSLLGWLLGRSGGADLSVTGRQDVPPPPRWG